MQEQDVVSIEYLEDAERFADLLNGYIFEGKQVVRPQDIRERNRIITKTRKQAQQLESRVVIRDVMRKVLFGVKVVVISLENQTDIHYAMPVRVMNAEVIGTAGIHKGNDSRLPDTSQMRVTPASTGGE